MFSSRWRFGWDRFSEVDLFRDRYEIDAETLSQAIRAAAPEEPDADGSVLFGHLTGTVVGLRYYTGVVRLNQYHPSHSTALIHKGNKTWVAKKIHFIVQKFLFGSLDRSIKEKWSV